MTWAGAGASELPTQWMGHIYQTFRTDMPLYIGGMMNRKCPGMPEGILPHWQFYFTVDDIEAVQQRVTNIPYCRACLLQSGQELHQRSVVSPMPLSLTRT